MLRTGYVLAAMAVAVATFGCMETVKEKQIEIKAPSDPMAPAITILQRYAEGQPMGSEATSFPKLVEDVKKTDAAKGETLAKGLDELQKSPPNARPAKAKEILQELQAAPAATVPAAK